MRQARAELGEKAVCQPHKISYNVADHGIFQNNEEEFKRYTNNLLSDILRKRYEVNFATLVVDLSECLRL